MKMVVFCQLGVQTFTRDFDSQDTVNHLSKTLNVNLESYYVIQNGRKVEADRQLEENSTYHFVPRMLGGKGGFGSMLRAIGAQIEKTTSREACRDLSGRRMRDVNNEKKLKEWLSKEADREREREERRQERLARRLAGPKHNFDDPEYHNQKSKVQEDLDDALQKGLKRANGKSSSLPSTSRPGPAKKMKSSNKEWLGMDVDSDDLTSDSDNEAHPGPPDLMEEGTGNPSGECCDVDHSAEPSSTSTEREEERLTSDVREECAEDSKEEIKKETDVEDVKQNIVGDEISSQTTAVPVKEEVISSDEPIDLDQVRNTEELVAMGLERLKNGLISRGLKCGGSLEERAERLFLVKGLAADQYPSSLMAKSKGGGKKSKSK